MSGIARRAMSQLVATSVVVALAGCGPNPPDTRTGNTADGPMLPISTSDAPLVDGVTGQLILTRQRDLLDRGLINVLTHNRSGRSMLLSDIELVADFFVGEQAAQRTISVRSGRQVAIQVPYGMTVDCADERPVRAELTFTYTTDENPRPSTARIDLGGTDILDSIRAEQCITRRFDEEVRTRFDNTEIVDGTVVTQLVIESVGTTADLTVRAVSGTVLVGVRSGGTWTGTRLDGGEVTIPLTFVVNRCDPHALAEVTKRFGLELAVSVEGAEPVAVAIDVSDLVGDLEAIVAQCVAASAPE
jgi:hypothetical protein